MTTPISEHIQHRELYYIGPSPYLGLDSPDTVLLVAHGHNVIKATERGIIIRQLDNIYTMIPWHSVVQFNYWHDDDIGATIEG